MWSGNGWRQEREYWETEGGTEGKHNLTVDILVLLLFKSFHPLFQDVSWFMGMGIGLQRHFRGLGTPGQLLSVFWSVMTFCSGLLCKTKILSRRVRTALIFGVRKPYLEWSYKSHWFVKMTVEGSSCWMYPGFNLIAWSYPQDIRATAAPLWYILLCWPLLQFLGTTTEWEHWLSFPLSSLHSCVQN